MPIDSKNLDNQQALLGGMSGEPPDTETSTQPQIPGFAREALVEGARAGVTAAVTAKTGSPELGQAAGNMAGSFAEEATEEKDEKQNAPSGPRPRGL